MSNVYPRRSERVALKRAVQLVFRSPRGNVEQVPAATFSVNCHGAGLYTHHYHPVGSEVFLMDSSSGIGAWGKLVWEGNQMRDGRFPVGVEFSRPGNHWKTRLVPPSWVPYVAENGATQRRYMHAATNKVVLVGRNEVDAGKGERASGEPCRCCGGQEEVATGGVQEPLCRVCREWVV